ncbi:MAG: VWA domain-containing protein [Paracoccaceae bacterium]
MSDDLDDLKAALDNATPAPDRAKKAAHLAVAQENFEQLQGSARPARPISTRPNWGLWTGAKAMLNSLTSRGGLTATTALVAVGFVFLTPLGENLLTPPAPRVAGEQQELAVLEHELEARLRTESADQEEADSLSVAEAVIETPMVLDSAGAELPATPSTARPPVRKMATPRQNTTASSSESLIAPDASRLDYNTEAFANNVASPLQITSETPVSTFSVDVDTASYAIIRNSLMNGYLPDPDAVRIEEMVNYFDYAYPEPEGTAPFRPTISVTPTPWNADTQLVQIGIQGVLPAIKDRPPLNLVFLIDTSGSMDQPNKLPLLKQSFRLMLGQLRPTDQISIVTYAGSAGQVLEPTNASDRSTILSALDRLGAGGSTAGQAGLQQAYSTAQSMAEEGEVTRVILATDGDFNVGISDPNALKSFIETHRESGTYLSVLGFGRGNLDDATMQALAQNGNGQAAYIDTLAEAQKVLVDQLTGALFPIANDVKIQVEFNAAQIVEYRLIGYETRALRREDFNNDAIDAGDIGAGHSVTALYEVTPIGSPAQLSDPLRYGADVATANSDELGFLRLRYKTPGTAASQLIETPITADFQGPTGFAAAIAGFGQLLRGGDYIRGWTYADAVALANASKGADPFGYRAEAIQLMRLAASLSDQ